MSQLMSDYYERFVGGTIRYKLQVNGQEGKSILLDVNESSVLLARDQADRGAWYPIDTICNVEPIPFGRMSMCDFCGNTNATTFTHKETKREQHLCPDCYASGQGLETSLESNKG